MAMAKRLAAMVLAGAGLFVSSSLGDVAKDWPQFQGPARDNVSKETGLLKDWPAGGPPLAWKIKGVGDGHSSVAVADGKIFTAGKVDDFVYLFALSEKDGQQIWKAEAGGLGSSNEGQGGKGPRSTPTVDGDRVYLEGPSGDLSCFAISDGKQLWRKNLKKDFGGKLMSGWGYSESVAIDGDNVICTPGGNGGTLLALDKKTGNPVWRSKELNKSATYASPVIAEIGGVRQIIVRTHSGGKNAGVAGVASKDGSVLWYADDSGGTAVIPTPIVKDNYVYLSMDYGSGCALFKITQEGEKFSAQSMYAADKRHVMENKDGGVILLNGFVYGHSDSGGWTCQDFMSGEAKWQNKGPGGKGTITYADDRFYLRDEGGKGTIVLIEASSDGYKEHGKFNPPDRSNKQAWPFLVVANGKLYVRDMDSLLCYDVKAK